MNHDGVKLFMQVLVSLVILGAGIYFLATPGTNTDLQKAAAGWIGIVVGYWLK